MQRFLVAFFIFIASPSFADDPMRTISVTGIGSTSATPDKATIHLGVEAQARTAREALSINSNVMEAVLDILKLQGVADSDMQTTQISLFPRFENRNSNRQPTVVGYNAQNTVQVTVQDIEGLGSILDKVSEAGGNRIHSISFGLKDRETPMNEARKRAVKNAMEKAELYASAAGVTLGPVLSISDSTQIGSPRGNFPMARAESMAMDVPIAEGELTLSAQVHLILSIDD